MTQTIFDRILIAFLGAGFILLILILIGVSLSYRDQIRKNRGFLLGRTAFLIFVVVFGIYLLIQEEFSTDILFVVLVWILPIILCTDWKAIWRKGPPEPVDEMR